MSGLDALEERIHSFEHGRRDVAERLFLLHDAKVVIHGEREGLDDLVQHLPVLPGEAHEHVETPAAPEFQHDGSHLDGFRPGAEGDEH